MEINKVNDLSFKKNIHKLLGTLDSTTAQGTYVQINWYIAQLQIAMFSAALSYFLIFILF